jgi:CBS domain containing-hemolysin-like protein
MNPWLAVAIGVVLTLATAIFVAAEFSFVALDRPTVEAGAERGDRRSARLVGALRTLSTQLSATQVGITVTTLLVGYLVEPGLSALLRPGLADLGLPATATAPVAVAVAMLLATAWSMVIGELIPKNLAIAEPRGTARAVVEPMRLFTLVAKPLVLALNRSANAVLRAVGVQPQEELSSARAPEELASMIRRSALAGTMPAGKASLIDRSLRLRDRSAQDVMTPRPRCAFVDKAAPLTELIELARQTGHSRFPVMDGDPDQVVGIAHLKKAIAVPRQRRADVPVGAITHDAMHVPATVPVESLLVDLRGQGLAVAIVEDEYGGTAGVVTLEDVVEELVGEVTDEHDSTRGRARRLRDGSWTVPGLWRADEIRDRAGAAVPDGADYETVGGFVAAQLGRLPAYGDEVALQGGMLRVLRMDGRRVDLVRYQPQDATGPAQAPPATGSASVTGSAGRDADPEELSRPGASAATRAESRAEREGDDR